MISKYMEHIESRGRQHEGAADNVEAKTISEEQFQDSMQAYWEQYPEYATAVLGRIVAAENAGVDGGDGEVEGLLSEVHKNVAESADPSSFLEVSAGVNVRKPAGGCEVCVYVVENKEQHQPFLCRGLKPPQYQQSCVSVLVSLMWWLENEVYWLNYGCQRDGGDGGMEWVKPCPAHAVCSFIKSMYDRSTFCPKDPKFHPPSA